MGLAFAVVLAFAAAPAARAQQTAPATAPAAAPVNFADTISGAVAVDGMAVPGVTVTVTDVASGQKYVTSTDESGRFSARVAHPGAFQVATDMPAFAPSEMQVTVPASGAALAPLQVNLTLASQATTAVATNTSPGSGRAGRRGGRGFGGRSAGGANGGNGSNGGRYAAQNGGGGFPGGGGAGAGGGGDGIGGGAASDVNGYEQLSVNQTGDISGNADAGAADSGIAAMNGSSATDSAVVSGASTQDTSPMNATQIRAFMTQNGISANSFGGGRGGPGGGFGGRGGGGFGGRGGFGGGGGFRFRGLQNRFNQPHGNFSYQLSDSSLNALPDSIDGATNTKSPPNAANQRYSASLTTPLKIPHIYDSKGKTSVTFSYFGTHDSSLSNVSALVPTMAERGGNFQGVTDAQGNPVTITDPSTGLPYSNNTITPGDISSAAQGLLAYIPTPTPGAVGQFNYNNTIDSLSTGNNFGLRINHSFSGQLGGGRGFFGRGRNLNFSMNYSGGNGTTPGTFYPYQEGISTRRGVNMSLQYTQPLGNWINMMSVNYNYSRNQITNLYANTTNIAGQLGIGGVSTNPLDWGLPTLSFTTSGLTGLNDTAPSFDRNQTWAFSDSFIRRMRNHNIRIGGDTRVIQSNPETDQSPNGVFTFDGQYSGYDFADFLLGLPQQTSEKYGGGAFYFRQVEPDLYFNDNWQMRGNFTLDFGLRWNYISPEWEKYGRLTNLLVGSDFSSLTPVVAGQDGVPATIIQPEYWPVRPSLGFAWQTWGNMIVTGGGGMAYNTGAYSSIATALAYQSPFIVTQTNLGTATTPLSLTNGFAGTNAVVNNYGVDPNYAMGYSILWNLDIQRTFDNVYVVNLDYSGTKGTDLDQLRAPNRTPTGLLYPNLPAFLYDTSGGNSIYHAGSVIVSRRLSNSVSFRASYIYSKMMDDASQIGGGGGMTGLIAQNDLDLAGERSLSSQNVTNRLSASYEWQLPYGLNHRWGDHSDFLSSSLGDWQFSGSITLDSGEPFSPTVSNIYSNAQGLQALGVTAPLRADVTGTPIAEASPTLTSFFNTAAFTAPAAGSYGDAGRNIIIGPGTAMFNASLSKTFRIGEFDNLEIQFNGTNVLNHPNWASIGTNLNSPTFGEVTGFGAPRSISLTTRFRF